MDVPPLLQVSIVMMLGVVTLIMTLFLGYHLLMLRAGMTTYETYKWRELRLRLQEQADQELTGCDLKIGGTLNPGYVPHVCYRLLPVFL